MRLENNEFAQVIYLDKGDIVEDFIYDGLKTVAVGCSPAAGVEMFRTILTDPDILADGKHVIFLVNEVWNKLSSTAQKAIMDHEFGHIADGQLDSEEMLKSTQDGGGGLVIKAEWEFAADDFSVSRNGRIVVFKALIETIKLFNQDQTYQDMGIDLSEEPTIKRRLARLNSEAQAA